MASIVDFFDKLERQNFGPKDSKLVSTVNNPGKGAKLLAEWLRDNVNTASSMYAPSYQQGEAATNLAGLAQMPTMLRGGEMPMLNQEQLGQGASVLLPASMLGYGLYPELSEKKRKK